jgi:hypothetical protein
MTGTYPGVLSAGETSRSRRRASPCNSLFCLKDDSGGETGLSENGDWSRRLDKGREELAGEGMSRKGRLGVDGEGLALDWNPDPKSLFISCEWGNGGGERREAVGNRSPVREITGGFVSGGWVLFAAESGGGVDVRS